MFNLVAFVLSHAAFLSSLIPSSACVRTFDWSCYCLLSFLLGALKSLVADGPIELDTLGAKVVAEKKFDDLYIGGAKVIATDVMASNGVVHVVDGVVEGV